MNYKVIIEPHAEKDIENAFYWIAEHSRSSAEKWYRNLMETIISLEKFPDRCPKAMESEAFQDIILQLLYGKNRNMYRILFTIQGNNVHVLHIRHCAQGYIEP